MYGSLKIWIITALLAIMAFVSAIHDFLAINHPVQANVLVIEGWICDSVAMKEAAEELKRGRYDVAVTVGTLPTWQTGEPLQDNSAVCAADQLRQLGVKDHTIQILAVPNIDRHRTYTSAMVVKRWLINSKINVSGINVFTIGTHARKSLVLFRRAFSERIPIGVIAGTEDSYDPKRWFISLNGIYAVLRKTIGYLYAKWWPMPDDLPTTEDHDYNSSLEITSHCQLNCY